MRVPDGRRPNRVLDQITIETMHSTLPNCTINFTKNLGQEINFNFEVERDAVAGYNSCGAWQNGEYYIIDGTYQYTIGSEPYFSATIRMVNIRRVF